VETQDEAAPLGWATTVDGKRITYQCPACTREHIRSIEATLGEEWW
jgi:hypothetical protein